MDFSDALYENFETMMLIFARIIGLFSFNPILSRSNIPARARIGATLIITYVLYFTVDIGQIDTGSTMGQFFMCVVRELFIGFILGFVCALFIYMIFFAGDIMDAQAGLSMAKVMDPASHIQTSVFGTYMGYMFYLYFFLSNSHLTLIRIFADSFDVIPLCSGYVNAELGWGIIEMFSGIVMIVIKLAMPVVAAEFILEMSIGILMKAVPQIHIMVVNVQLKAITGFVILLAITSPLSEFIESYTDNMLGTCRDVLPLIFR